MSRRRQFQGPRNGLNRRSFLGHLGLGAAATTGLGATFQASPPTEPGTAPAAITPDQQEDRERRTRNEAARAIIRKAKSNGLNLVVVIADTFRRDHLGPYGSTYAKTPCLDELGKQSVVFENVFADGLPTIPCRRVYHTGKSVLPNALWIPNPAGEINISQILGAHGFWTGLVSDVYHYFKPDMNLHVGFDTWEWIRGQEMDAYRGGPREQFQPKEHMPPDLWSPAYDKSMQTYMMNTQDRQSEADYFASRTVRSSIDWLKQNATNRPFMLWVEMFDPHEPWDAPERFQKMYRNDYGYKRFLFGYGVQSGDRQPGQPPDFTPHLPVIRDLYAAEVTYVDHCIGQLMEAMAKMKLLDDTIVVFTTDHGTHLGELGYVQKQPALLNSAIMHLPLLIRHPERSTAGKRVSSIVSAVDLAPTFCHMLGIDDQEHMDGRNAWHLVADKVDRLHDCAFTRFGNFASVRTGKWHYFQHVAGMVHGAGPCLFDLEKDPHEAANVIGKYPDVAADLRARLADRLQQVLPEIPAGYAQGSDALGHYGHQT
jgi:arylsulfatase A-like enzyme